MVQNLLIIKTKGKNVKGIRILFPVNKYIIYFNLQLYLLQGLDAQNPPLLTPLEFSVWLERVWFSHVTTPSFLLADSFSVHTAELTKKLVLKVTFSL